MKNILVLLTVVAVIALSASISSATPTLNVWTQLVSCTDLNYNINIPETNADYSFGTTPVAADHTGLYGVQIWASISNPVSTTTYGGIAIMDATLYAIDNNTRSFTPMYDLYPTPSPGIPYTVSTQFNDGYSSYNPVAPYLPGAYLTMAPMYENNLDPSNPDAPKDAYQLAISAAAFNFSSRHYGATEPVLIATEAWNLTSLANQVDLGVFVDLDAYTPKYFSDDSGGKTLFTSVNGVGQNILYPTESPVPEPLTLAALGMGIAGLGGYIRRRRTAVK